MKMNHFYLKLRQLARGKERTFFEKEETVLKRKKLRAELGRNFYITKASVIINVKNATSEYVQLSFVSGCFTKYDIQITFPSEFQIGVKVA